jgi:hypothetical protein
MNEPSEAFKRAEARAARRFAPVTGKAAVNEFERTAAWRVRADGQRIWVSVAWRRAWSLLRVPRM